MKTNETIELSPNQVNSLQSEESNTASDLKQYFSNEETGNSNKQPVKKPARKFRIPLPLRIAPFYLLVATLFVIPIYTNAKRASSLTSEKIAIEKQLASAPVLASPETTSPPKELLIPQLGLNLKVETGTIDDTSKQWTVSKDHPNFALESAMPNNNDAGKVFIYGHRLPHIFGRLNDSIQSQNAYITDQNGNIWKYRLYKTVVVKPDNMAVLDDMTKGDDLVLMTCTGPFDSLRLVQYYELEKVAA